MSGTSLDGLDIAYCEFEHHEGKWSFELKAAQNIDYSDNMRRRLKESINLSAIELLALDIEYGKWLGNHVLSFMNEFGIKVDYIASHGHTVHHQPEKGITFQIGAGQEMANATGLPVICDFRSKDVSLGGQGAPLVPVGDQYLFSNYDFCLNLGGISNVSFEKDGSRIAYDIGLANMILNYITAEIGLKHDAGGVLAKSGKINETLFKQLNDLEYYSLPFPKSTGYEWFLACVVPLVDGCDISTEDKLCTGVHHIAYTVARDIQQHSKQGSQVMIAGGGAKNDFLMYCLREYLGKSAQVYIPKEEIIEFKEAIVFGLLGVLRLRNESNCLKSVTGATKDNCGGVIYNPS